MDARTAPKARTGDPAYLGVFEEVGGHPVRPWPRYSEPKAGCATCSLRGICEGCRKDDGCSWCSCDALGCSSCGTKCRSHESLELWMHDVGSLDLWADLRDQPSLSLPRYVPSVKIQQKMRTHLPPWTYTIAINDLIRSNGHPREVAYCVRDFFPEGSQLILNFFSEDRYLEPIWTRGADFWEAEWLSQFDAIVAVNYSLYLDDSSFEIMHSLRRSYVAAQEIHDAGHTIIPLLSYVSEKQLFEQIEALSASNVHTVCVNMQVVEGARATYQRQSVEFLRRVAELTPWRLIAHGVAREEVILELAEIFGERLILSNSDPFFWAMRRPTGGRSRVFSDGLKRYLTLAEGRPWQSLRQRP